VTASFSADPLAFGTPSGQTGYVDSSANDSCENPQTKAKTKTDRDLPYIADTPFYDDRSSNIT
jgi:hypothetical protein